MLIDETRSDRINLVQAVEAKRNSGAQHRCGRPVPTVATPRAYLKCLRQLDPSVPAQQLVSCGIAQDGGRFLSGSVEAKNHQQSDSILIASIDLPQPNADPRLAGRQARAKISGSAVLSCRPTRSVSKRPLFRSHTDRLRPLGSLADLENDPLILFQRTIAASADLGKVDEDVL